MDREAKQLLQATLALAEENNKLLHKIRGVQKRETLWQVLKIVVVIAITLGAFYYIDPYLNKLVDMYNSVSGVQEKINSSPLQDLLKKL